MSGMRKAMDEVGGTLRIRPGQKRGLVVEAAARKEAR
jgi:hypothetical protein